EKEAPADGTSTLYSLGDLDGYADPVQSPSENEQFEKLDREGDDVMPWVYNPQEVYSYQEEEGEERIGAAYNPEVSLSSDEEEDESKLHRRMGIIKSNQPSTSTNEVKTTRQEDIMRRMQQEEKEEKEKTANFVLTNGLLLPRNREIADDLKSDTSSSDTESD